MIRVRDTVAPVVYLSVEVATLWSPDHKMVLAARFGATDVCADSPASQVWVTSDEPADATGDGSTAPDWELVRGPDGAIQIWLRAERSGSGEGRAYTITATAEDAAGNRRTAAERVFVARP